MQKNLIKILTGITYTKHTCIPAEIAAADSDRHEV